SFPPRADGIRVAVRRDAPIGGCDDARSRIVNTGQLVEWNVSRPLMGVVAAIFGKAAVARCTNRNLSRGLVSDVAIHVGKHNVLPGRVKRRESAAELFPALRQIYFKERIM